MAEEKKADNGAKKAFNLAQTNFEERWAEVRRDKRRTGRVKLIRTGLAYLLKSIAVTSGLFVAVVEFYQWDSGYTIPAGLAASAAVILDGVISNFKRLIAYAPAYYSYDNLLQDIGNRSQNEHQKLAHLQESNPTKFAKDMAKVYLDLRNALFNKSQEIKKTLQQVNIDALHALKMSTAESLQHSKQEV